MGSRCMKVELGRVPTSGIIATKQRKVAAELLIF